MDRDELMELIQHLPDVKKDITFAYMENNRLIKRSLEFVLERELDEDEKMRLRQHSFDLAITLVAKNYKEDLKKKDE